MKQECLPGVKVGHAQDQKAKTGVTVVLFEEAAVCAVDVRGGAPGTRETELLRPENTVSGVHAIVLSGGSAFGLNACAGVMQYLEECGIGFDTGFAKVPIVPAAVLYDLGIGNAAIRPDASMGYQACQNAQTWFETGAVGVGTGATVGKILGMAQASAGGFGSCRLHTEQGLEVLALIALNAFGDVWKEGKIIAGARDLRQEDFLDTQKLLLRDSKSDFASVARGQNTTLGIVLTNAQLDKSQALKVASMGHDGLARAIAPIHTSLDGDTLFAAATGQVPASVDQVGTLACLAVQEAIYASLPL